MRKVEVLPTRDCEAAWLRPWYCCNYDTIKQKHGNNTIQFWDDASFTSSFINLFALLLMDQSSRYTHIFVGESLQARLKQVQAPLSILSPKAIDLCTYPMLLCECPHFV